MKIPTQTLAVACTALAASVAHADAVGLPPMNLGNTSFLDGIAGPGFLFELASSYYRATSIRDNAGHAVPGNPRIETAAIVPHVAYISPDITLLGGNVGAEVLLPLVYANIRPGPGAGDHNFAAGDIQFSPFIVQWSGQTLFGMPFFQRFDLLFSAPTGQYDPNRLANAGSNVWTVTPYYAFTVMPTGKLEVSGRLNYQWSGKNTRPPSSLEASSIQPGDALSLNLSASYAISKRWRVGVAGYMLGQLGEDRIDGIRQAESRERVFGAGPGLMVQGDGWQVLLNAYKEWGARNRPEGSKVVLRVLAPF
ncbi:putative MetA-pathway of phenol degradation [compost metagenome]